MAIKLFEENFILRYIDSFSSFQWNFYWRSSWCYCDAGCGNISFVFCFSALFEYLQWFKEVLLAVWLRLSIHLFEWRFSRDGSIKYYRGLFCFLLKKKPPHLKDFTAKLNRCEILERYFIGSFSYFKNDWRTKSYPFEDSRV